MEDDKKQKDKAGKKKPIELSTPKEKSLIDQAVEGSDEEQQAAEKRMDLSNSDLLRRIQQAGQPQLGDETVIPNSARNALARLYNESIRPTLPSIIQPPEASLQSLADEKRWASNLPESMGMGSLGTISNTARGVSQMAGQAGMNAAEQLAAAVPSQYGRVAVRDIPIRPAFEKLRKIIKP